ncbi:hypothetical protein Pmani_019995 [Petrolisthes manimaculis]|uniref:Aminopeptidase n=1 Tax=Petrolisthes manimaculis TaxID=1843537 RepID=A0AAE1U727_9EUCA|nr:hypothetical protein Pmani_019995 [Petrolisthes manimaculis]
MTSQVSKAANPWEDSIRLPSTVHPDHYDLYTHPDLTTKTFRGRVSITVTSSEPRDHFIVHTQWLNITSTDVVRVTNGDTQPVNVMDAFEYEPNQFWVISTPLVEAGVYRITLEFSGSLVKGILGYYYSDYTDENGQERGLATTKFEPTYARRAFPCMDEPSFKSTYNITVVKPTLEYIALSNMPVMNEEIDMPSPGLTEVTFEKSVPMVTYLVCFIVCDFTYKETIMSSGMPFRVYAPSGRIDNTDYSLSVASSILQMYEVMFDLAFPLPKCDMAAIPDYSSGATEHWGIITFRETSIFYNVNVSSATNKQRVSSVVSHELAHQWFGNLVTLAWWDDLWLNEGFASYVEYKGVDSVHPDWDMNSQFVIDLQEVLIDDAKVNSHPIVQHVETPDEINSIFDTISYNKDGQQVVLAMHVVLAVDSYINSHPIVIKVKSTHGINAMFDVISYKKGSSVLRMLEGFMGESSYQAGINSFLKKFAYDNAVTQDLWDELTAAWAGQVPDGDKSDVGVIMDTWTRQMGYPVLTVTRTSPNTFNVTQVRFLQDPNAVYDPSESEYGYKWDVPIGYLTSTSPDVKRTWLYREMENLNMSVEPASTWLKVNVRQEGYYRVNYEPEMWAQLETACTDKLLGTADRANLYNDVFALADAALLDYTVALNFSRTLVSETEYVPWTGVRGNLIIMQRLLETTQTRQPFTEYVASLVNPVYTTLGWEDEGSHLHRLLRSDIVYLACASNITDCLGTAATILDSWIIDASYPLPLDTRRQVYRWGVVQGDAQQKWEVMWQRALTEQSATEIDNLYYGMANVQDTVILLRYIEESQDEKNVRTQNFITILMYISSNPAGTDLVWSWVRTNWEWLVDRYTLNDRGLSNLIPSITRYFATPERLTEIEEFFSQYPDAGTGQLNREQALETVRFNIRWVESNSPVIQQWLDSNSL